MTARAARQFIALARVVRVVESTVLLGLEPSSIFEPLHHSQSIMAALDTLQADVLQGRAVANETAAALLPLIASADPIVAGLETSGALKRLAQGDSVQVSGSRQSASPFPRQQPAITLLP